MCATDVCLVALAVVAVAGVSSVHGTGEQQGVQSFLSPRVVSLSLSIPYFSF